jgi:hypothetical protein
VPNHSSPRLAGAVRAAVALGIVMLLTACGGGGGGVSTNSQWCPEEGCGYVAPTPPHSRFLVAFVGQGEVTRTTGGCRVRMPKVEIEETAGYGGSLAGSTARITYYDAAGTSRRVEEYLVPRTIDFETMEWHHHACAPKIPFDSHLKTDRCLRPEFALATAEPTRRVEPGWC